MHTLMSSNRQRRRRGAARFTLLEVLIAILVVAPGLLGLAGLQVFALKNNQSAGLRVAATNLTTDIIERMKANVDGVTSYHRPDSSNYTTGEVDNCNKVDGCKPEELAATDLVQWRRRVAATLPGGIGVVCVDDTPDDNSTPAVTGCGDPNTTRTPYVVKIWWYDDRTRLNKDPTLKVHVHGVQPNARPMKPYRAISSPRRTVSRGVTLVELMVAIAIGLLLVAVIVDEGGVVRKLQIAESEPPGLFDEAAKLGWQDVRFLPARLNGVAVKSQKLIELNYTPSER